MRLLLSQRPLLTGAAAFAAGIGLSALGHLPPLAALCLAALGTAALAARRWPALFPIGLLLLGLSAGAIRLASFQAVPPTDISHLADSPRPLTILGTVSSDPEARPGGRLTFFLRAAQAETRGQSAPVTGEVSVSLGPDAAHGLVLDYGDRVQLEGLLDTPEAATNPGAFSWRDYLARRAVYAELRVKRPGAASGLGAPSLFDANPFLALAWQVRKAALNALQSSLPPAEAAVLSGILIGRRSDLPPDLMADFVHTGTVHVLASAGLHVGILAFWLEQLFRRLTLPRKAQAALLIAFLLLYALVCGGRPAVVRAVLMTALYFGAVLFEREPDGPTAIGAAGLVILVLQPTALLEPGFQLSFLTILTLALTMPLWNDFWHPKLAGIRQPRIRKAAEWAADGFGLSLLAQLGAMPVVASAYSEVSLIGWLANGLVVPVLFVLIPLGLLGILLGTLWHASGVLLLTAAGWGVSAISRVVRGLGELPGAYLSLSPPPLPLVLLFYALIYGGTDFAQRFINQRSMGKDFAPTPASVSAAAAGAAGLVGTVPPP
jgi:competence protein ComEC